MNSIPNVYFLINNLSPYPYGKESKHHRYNRIEQALNKLPTAQYQDILICKGTESSKTTTEANYK